MQVVSTRWTLFFKVILSTVWVCFFGALSILVLFFDINVSEPFSPTTAKILIISFSFSSIGMLYLLFMRIKWVALSNQHFLVSNFFKSYQYSYESIKSIEEVKILWWKRLTFELHTAGTFGKKIVFIAGYQWEAYLQKKPEIMQLLVDATNPKTE
jgi:hypothetical protein